MEEVDNPSPKKPVSPGITIKDAVSSYLKDARARGLVSSTLSKLKTTFEKQLLEWAKSNKFTALADLDIVAMRDFRSTWKDAPLAKSKKQSRLTGFFYFCQRSRWIDHNPMLGVGKIKVKHTPTDYFPANEFDQIIKATYQYRDSRADLGIDNGKRIRALTWLMRWSGLRIRDAVTLERSRLSSSNKLLLYQAKTGEPVYVPLPDDVAEALRTVQPGRKLNPRYFFWSGHGDPKSAVADWQRSYRRLFTKYAKLEQPDKSPKRCHPHMFRDTFAIGLLLSEVPIDQVSILLGHQSVKVTEKHYAPWVRARQQQLESNVIRSWKSAAQPADKK
jgi:integrase